MTQIRKLDEKIRLRSRSAAAIVAGLAGIEWVRPLPFSADGSQNFYALVMQIIDPKVSVKKVDQHLADRQVISDTSRYAFRPLYEYPLFPNSGKPCKNAEAVIGSVFTLPCHEGLNESDISQIVDAVRAFPCRA
jgi:dTDP-4-amino-4,6-dideoxygalactose transaminase